MGIYENFTQHSDRRKIVILYAKHQLISDLLPTISLLISLKMHNIFILSIVGFMRFSQIMRIKRIIEEHFHLPEKYPSITTLTKLLFLIFTMAHFCSCGFQYAGSE